jgi:hypothetical protein
VTYVEEEVTELVDVPSYAGINIEKALENLKVNQKVFNFFLKQQQYGIKDYIKQRG